MAPRGPRLVALRLDGEGERAHAVLFQGAVTERAARRLLVHEHGPLAVRAIAFSHRGRLLCFIRHRHRARGERSPACIGGKIAYLESGRPAQERPILRNLRRKIVNLDEESCPRDRDRSRGRRGSASAGVPRPEPRTILQALTQFDLSCRLHVQPDAVHLLGETITIDNACTGTQTVYQRDGFWTVTLDPGEERERRILGAGTYLSAVVLGQWHAPIKVLPRALAAPSTNSFTVRWRKRLSHDLRFGVQYPIGPGTGGPGSPAPRFGRRSSTERTQTYFFQQTISPGEATTVTRGRDLTDRD